MRTLKHIVACLSFILAGVFFIAWGYGNNEIAAYSFVACLALLSILLILYIFVDLKGFEGSEGDSVFPGDNDTFDGDFDNGTVDGS